MTTRYDGYTLVARVSKGVGALSLGTTVSLIGQVVIVPVAMVTWGQIRYGEWLALSGLVAFLKLSDLGIQTYVVNRLTAAYSTGQRDELQQTLHSAVKVQIPLVGVGLLALGTAVISVPLGDWLELQTVGGLGLGLVVWLLGVELLTGVPMGVYAGVYRATGRLARAAVVGATQQALLYGCTIALVAWDLTFVSVAAARVTVAIGVSAFILRDLKKLYPWLELWPASGSWTEGLGMVIPGLFFLLIPVAEQLSNQFTILVVQRWLDGGEVSRLATHRTAINASRMASALLATAAWPELTALRARDERGRLLAIVSSLTKINIWIVGTAILILLVALPWIYPLWTVGRLDLELVTMGVLAARVGTWSVWNIGSTTLLATNRHRPVALCLAGSGIVAGALAIPLVQMLGMRGAVLASLLGDLCLPAWFIPRLVLQELGGSATRAFKETVLPGFTVVGLPLLLGLSAWALISDVGIRYLVVVPMCAISAIVLIWWHMTPRERRWLRLFLSKDLQNPRARSSEGREQ